MKPMSHISCSRECTRVWGNEPSHSQVNFHFGSWSPKCTLESLGNNCRGQNSMDWSVPYIIENILELKCPKWACVTHLNIRNISYGRKKGWKSNNQFDYWPLEVKNRTDLGGVRHTFGKLLTKATTLLQTSLQLEVYMQCHGLPKSWES
jgi:hypothetical protein